MSLFNKNPIYLSHSPLHTHQKKKPHPPYISSALSVASSHAEDSDSTTYEERGRLLSADSISTSPSAIRPSALRRGSSGCSRRNSPLASKRSAGSSLHDSADSFHEKSPLTGVIQPSVPQRSAATSRRPLDATHNHHHHQRATSRAVTAAEQQQQQQPASAGASRHCSRHPSMRSLKSSSASDEHHCYPVRRENKRKRASLTPTAD